VLYAFNLLYIIKLVAWLLANMEQIYWATVEYEYRTMRERVLVSEKEWRTADGDARRRSTSETRR